MDHRIIDILVYLAKHFHTNSFGMAGGTEFDVDIVVNSLQDEGYSQSEIDSALSWYFENEKMRPQFRDKLSLPLETPAIRILHPIERVLISPEAYGFLMQIHQLGLISTNQLESIIDKALSSGWEIDVILVKTIASVVIFDNHDEVDLNETGISPLI